MSSMQLWQRFLILAATQPGGDDQAPTHEWLASNPDPVVRAAWSTHNANHPHARFVAEHGDNTAALALLDDPRISPELITLLCEHDDVDVALSAACSPLNTQPTTLARTLRRLEASGGAALKGQLPRYVRADAFTHGDEQIGEFLMRYAQVYTVTKWLRAMAERGTPIGEKTKAAAARRINGAAIEAMSTKALITALARVCVPNNNLATVLEKIARRMEREDLQYAAALRWWLAREGSSGPDPMCSSKSACELVKAVQEGGARWSDDAEVLTELLSSQAAPVAALNPALPVARRRELLSRTSDEELIQAVCEAWPTLRHPNDASRIAELRELVGAINRVEAGRTRKTRVRASALKTLLEGVRSSDELSVIAQSIDGRLSSWVASHPEADIEVLKQLPVLPGLLRNKSPAAVLEWLLQELDENELEVFSSLVEEFTGTLAGLVYVAKACSTAGVRKRPSAATSP